MDIIEIVSSSDREVVILGMRMIQNDFLRWVRSNSFLYYGITSEEILWMYKNLNSLQISQNYIEFRYNAYNIRRSRKGFIELIKNYLNEH